MDPQNTTTQTHDSNTLMGILCYLGPLVIITLLTAKNDPFVKFHIKQGLVLFVIEVIIWLLTPMFFWQMWSLLQIINFLTLVLSIMGIINVVQKRERMLPVIGGFSSYFKF